MNIAAAAQQLLAFFPPEERQIPDASLYPGRNAAVMQAMNAALQEMCLLSGEWTSRDSRGARTHAPAQIPIEVTADSTAVTIAESDWEARYEGCSVVISGDDSVDNQLRTASRTNTLRIPYGGPTGSALATIFQDSIPLASDVVSVIEPIRYNRKLLYPMEAPTANIQAPTTPDYGRHIHDVLPNYEPMRVGDAASNPNGYYIETWRASASSAPSKRIRLSPAPSGEGVLEYECSIVPMVISDLSSTSALPIPLNFVQSIFMPLASFHLSRCPFTQMLEDQSKIDTGYQTARKQLSDSNPYPTERVRFTTKG